MSDAAMARPTYEELAAMLAETVADLSSELELTRCLKEYGEDCTDAEPCAVCAKWERVTRAGQMLNELDHAH